MLTIDGSPVQDVTAACKTITPRLKGDAPKERDLRRHGAEVHRVPGVTERAATFREADVISVYTRLLNQAKAQVAESEAATQWCLANLNSQLAGELTQQANAQATTLAGLQAQNTVVITRGTNPVQSKAILENRTMGGAPLDGTIVTAPTSADADAQTGFGDKNTGGGLIEEWSLGVQFGFASDGFLLIGEVSTALVTLPKSDRAVVIGEAGVCGYAALGMRRVTIAQPGRPLSTDPVQSQLAGINKQIGQKRINVVELLQAAARG